MPGLIRGAARVAVVAGTATAVSNRVSRRQARRWGNEEQAQAEQQQAYAAPPPGPGPDQFEQLTQLGQLHEQGVLTDEEFAVQKSKILAG